MRAQSRSYLSVYPIGELVSGGECSRSWSPSERFPFTTDIGRDFAAPAESSVSGMIGRFTPRDLLSFRALRSDMAECVKSDKEK